MSGLWPISLCTLIHLPCSTYLVYAKETFLFLFPLPLPSPISSPQPWMHALPRIASPPPHSPEKRKKTHNFLPNILSLNSTCPFLIIFYSVAARIAGTEPFIILLQNPQSLIPKLAFIWLKVASCSCF